MATNTQVIKRPVNIGSIPNDHTGDALRNAFDKVNQQVDAITIKVNTIEDSAQVNPTAAQIKTSYESNADTNAFTTAYKTKLDGIAAGAQVNTVNTVAGRTGTIILTANDVAEVTNKRWFLDAERTKLTGIAAGAQVNPTAAQIKTSYESNADTNAFTNAYKTKVDGIAAGAQVNTVNTVFGRSGAVVAASGDYSAALISFAAAGGITATEVQTALAWLGNNKTGLFKSTTTDTTTDYNNILTPGPQPVLYGNSNPNGPVGGNRYHVLNIRWVHGETIQFAFPYDVLGGNLQFRFRATDSLGTWSQWYTMWTSRKQGASSGLDADLIDGLHLADLDNRFAAKVHVHAVATTSVNGFLSAADKTKLDGIASGAQVNAVTTVAGRTGAVTIASTDVTDTTTIGRTVMTAVDATAVRNALGLTAFATTDLANYTRRIRDGHTITGGGTISVTDAYVKWSDRFVAISNGGNSSTYTSIFCPASGVSIPYASGSGSATTTANGIPLARWESLWYDSATGLFKIYQHAVTSPTPAITEIPLCRRNEDGVVTTFIFPNGIILLTNQTYDSKRYSSLLAPNSTLFAGQAASYYTNIVARLGYTPVKTLNANVVSIGWTNPNLTLTVDATNFGATWPISINGNAATVNGYNVNQNLRTTDNVTFNIAKFNGYSYVYNGFEIQAVNPSLWLHYPGVKRARWVIDNSGNLIWQDQYGTAMFTIAPSGALSSNQLGDVYTWVRAVASNAAANRWVHVGDQPWNYSTTGIGEPYAGAAITGYQGGWAGPGTVSAFRFRQLQYRDIDGNYQSSWYT